MTYSQRVVSDLSAINLSWKVFKHASVLLTITLEQYPLRVLACIGTRNSPRKASLHIWSSLMPARNQSSNVMLNKSLEYTLPQILFDIIMQAKVLLY